MCRMEKFPGHGLCPDFSGPGRPARSMHIPVPVPGPISNFHTSPFSIWKSFIGRFSNRKWRPWGRSWWKWLFSLKEMHCANHDMESFLIWKTIIGRFSNKKWAIYRSWPGEGEEGEGNRRGGAGGAADLEEMRFALRVTCDRYGSRVNEFCDLFRLENVSGSAPIS